MSKYIVELSVKEREHLESIIHSGKSSAELNRKARILLKADQSFGRECLTDEMIAHVLDTSVSTVERLRKRFVEEGFDSSLNRRKSTTLPHNLKVDGKVEALIVAVATSPAPEGCSRWTLNLIANKLVELKAVDSISDVTVSKALKKTKSSRGRRRNGV